MDNILQKTFSSVFTSMKMLEFCLFLFIIALVQIMAWRRPGIKPFSEPIMVNLPTHICVTRP